MTGILFTVSECFFLHFPNTSLDYSQVYLHFSFLHYFIFNLHNFLEDVFLLSFFFSSGSWELDTWEHLQKREFQLCLTKGLFWWQQSNFVPAQSLLGGLFQNLPRPTHLHASPVLGCLSSLFSRLSSALPDIGWALILLPHVLWDRLSPSTLLILQGGPQVRECKQGYINLPPTSMYFSNLTNKTFYCCL